MNRSAEGSSTDAPLTSMSSTDSEPDEPKVKKIIIWRDRNQRVQLMNVDQTEEMDTGLPMHQLDDRDPNLVYAKFLHAYHCYDLIPTSSKLVVFDTQLNYNAKMPLASGRASGIKIDQVADMPTMFNVDILGILTITDFIKILQRYYKENGGDMKELEEHKLSTWRDVLHEYSRPLVQIEPEASLFEAIQHLWDHRVHRLPVIDSKSGNPLYILTHKRILRFLFLYIYELPEPEFMRKSLRELNLGTYENVFYAHRSTPLIEAFNLFTDNRISALPVVDDKNKVVDIYAKFDVIHLAADKSYNSLNNLTVEDALRKRKKVDDRVGKCYITDSLKTVMEQIVQTEYHRLAVVEKDNVLVGIISLSDILHFLILKPLDDANTN